MRDPDGRFGFVDVLAAGAGTAVGVYPEILLLDGDVDVVVNFGSDVHGGEGGLSPLVGVEGRDPDQPVHADLAF